MVQLWDHILSGDFEAFYRRQAEERLGIDEPKDGMPEPGGTPWMASDGLGDDALPVEE